MKYEPRLVAPELDNEFYYSNKNIFTACGYGAHDGEGNCTWYAHARYMENFNADSECRGNAGGWVDEIKKKQANHKTTKKISDTPELGAIIVWKNPGTANNGHVAVVEEIYANGDIKTSNSAWNSTLFYLQKHKKADGYNWKSSKTGKVYEFQGFILPPDKYLADLHKQVYGEEEEEAVSPSPSPSLVDPKEVLVVPITTSGINEAIKQAEEKAKQAEEDKSNSQVGGETGEQQHQQSQEEQQTEKIEPTVVLQSEIKEATAEAPKTYTVSNEAVGEKFGLSDSVKVEVVASKEEKQVVEEDKAEESAVYEQTKEQASESLSSKDKQCEVSKIEINKPGGLIISMFKIMVSTLIDIVKRKR